MDINENQKAVPKSLRNTLNIDILWKANSFASRNQALMIYLAEKLGEDSHSPLYKRVITGENVKTSMRCLTTENIKLALEKTHFLNKYRKNTNTIQYQGTFDKQNNDATSKMLYPFLCKSLAVIQRECQDEWDKGSEGFLTINNCIAALIMIIDDFVQIKLAKQNLIVVDNSDTFFTEIEPFLESLALTISCLSEEEITKIKKSKGAGGPTDSYNVLRLALNHNDPEYTYPALVKFIEEFNTDYNPEANDLLTKILQLLRDRIKENYPDETDWLRNYVPESLRNTLLSKRAIDSIDKPEAKVWDYLTFAQISALASHKTNWSLFYKGLLKIEGAEAKGAAVSWLKEMDACYNDVTNNRKISTAQFQRIAKIAAAFSIE